MATFLKVAHAQPATCELTQADDETIRCNSLCYLITEASSVAAVETRCLLELQLTLNMACLSHPKVMASKYIDVFQVESVSHNYCNIF